VSTAHALRGFQESAISLLLLFDVTRYTFKVAPQTDTSLEAAIITALFRGALSNNFGQIRTGEIKNNLLINYSSKKNNQITAKLQILAIVTLSNEGERYEVVHLSSGFPLRFFPNYPKLTRQFPQ
jgi:hypothetical protein